MYQNPQDNCSRKLLDVSRKRRGNVEVHIEDKVLEPPHEVQIALKSAAKEQSFPT